MTVSKVSVVTVCLNARDTIRLTLESVRSQSFPNMEHVIIDGGSKDGTQDIALEYEPGYFISEADNGVYEAMDKGARAATGDIVIFLNAGDTFFDDSVCSEVAAFFDETSADLVFGNLMPVYLRPTDSHDHGAFQAGVALDFSYIHNRSQLYDNSIHHQATFYRRWILEKCTYACPKTEATGEYNLLLNAVMKHGAKVKHIPIIITRFVLGGISTRNFEQEWSKYVIARDILRELYFPEGRPTNLADVAEFVYGPHRKLEPAPPLSGGAGEPPASPKPRKSIIGRMYARFAKSLAGRIATAIKPHVNEVVHHQAMGIVARIEVAVAQQLGDAEKRIGNVVFSHALGTFERVEVAVDRLLRELEKRIEESNRGRPEEIRQELQTWIQGEIAEKFGVAEKRISDVVYRHALGTVERVEVAVDRQLRELEKRIEESNRGWPEEIRQGLQTWGRELQTGIHREIAEKFDTLPDAASWLSNENAVQRVLVELTSLQREAELLLINQASLRFATNESHRFEDHGFKVFSQWDEDGLIQYLVRRIPNCIHRFVEFGVGDYSEANSRLLLERENWVGLVLDSSEENIRRIRGSRNFWRHSLTAVQAFIDRDNINTLLSENGFTGDIGLLSIDVDGADYWIWEAITVVSPQIVICEYNGAFGSKARVTVPYRPDFDRTKAHFSWMYAGASLAALAALGRKKGYSLVGTNSGGNNAFFVRDEVLSASSIQSMQAPFTRPRFREARTPDGRLAYLDVADALKLVENKLVIDLDSGQEIPISEITLSYDPHLGLLPVPQTPS